MATAPRQSHLAAIHMAQKALGLSAEDASALKLAITGQASSASMSAAQRAKYLAHLSGLQERAGLIAPRPQKRPHLKRSVADEEDERWGKARALWHALAVAGVMHTDMGFTISNRKHSVKISATGSDANALFEAMCKSVKPPIVTVVCARCHSFLPASDRLKHYCQPCADAVDQEV
jgi:hypothetical protein